MYDRQECERGRLARTGSRDKDGRNSSRGETIVREREEGERKTGSARSFALAEEIAEEEEEDAEHVCLPQKKRENQV